MSQWPEWLPLSERLRPLSPYGAPQLPAEAVLNTNENPFPLSQGLATAIAARVESVARNLNRYPDRDATTLRKGLAEFINSQSGIAATQENIWAANGSNEIIQSLFLAFGDKGAIGFTPSYSMHPLIARVTNTHWSDGRRREDFSLDISLAREDIAKSGAALTFITTPNNPTGSSVTISEIEELAKSVAGLLVVDEAYAEFSDEVSAVTLIQNYPNVVVIRTMSKAFSFAGVRLGYLVADASVINALFLVRLPYHLSALTQAAAEVALEYRGELLGNVATLIHHREWVKDQLEGLGLRVIPSKANFLLFSGFDIPAPTLWKSLLDAGVLIRDVGLSGYLRVTIGSEAENELFISALKGVLNTPKK
ncbi:HisC Histidinol-phosphate/aromatic aminotransferase and cobyric acid decarboxylase [Candidatus Nanopelagicaceae bacterium]